MNEILKTIDTLLKTQSKKATCYVTPKFVVKATRRGGRRVDSTIEILLTIGKPNFAERDFIKKCKKVGEKFPVRKIQLKEFKK